MQHHIQQQRIELFLRDNEYVFTLQQTISDGIRNIVAPALEEIFDLYSTPEEITIIDTLEIDIGAVNASDIHEGRWNLLVIKALQEALGNSRLLERNFAAIRKPLADRNAKRWLAFLQNGAWPVSGMTHEDFNEGLRMFLMPNGDIEALAQLLLRYPQSIKRLVLTSGPEILSEILERLGAIDAAQGREGIRTWALFWKMLVSKCAALSPEILKATLPFPFETAWLEMADFWGEKPGTGRWRQTPVGQTLRYAEVWAWNRFISWALTLPGRAFPAAERLTLALGRDLFAEGVFESMVQWVSDQSLTGASKPENATGSIEVPKTQTFSLPLDSAVWPGDTGEGVITVLQDPATENTILQDIDSTAWYPDHAGIVLLHPFFSTLFQVLGYVSNGQFRDEYARQTAVQLLHFIAAGSGEVHDSMLLLPKLLCGHPLHQPVDGQIVLTKKEKREAEKMMRNAIKHWGALGKTSPEGLREGYLHRAGKLEQHDLGWNLKVESNTLDILLDRLPWGMGMIRLPWMNDLLIVEWN